MSLYFKQRCIDVLEDVKHPRETNCIIINNKINFLKDVLNECRSYNINQGYNPLEWLK
jgi:hypothetical protein